MKSNAVDNELARIIDAFSEKAKAYLQKVESRNVFPTIEALKNLGNLNIELQNHPISPETVLNELDTIGSPATVTNTGGRFFGFVIGGSFPAALGANLMAGVWDQNAGLEIASPSLPTLKSFAAGG